MLQIKSAAQNLSPRWFFLHSQILVLIVTPANVCRAHAHSTASLWSFQKARSVLSLFPKVCPTAQLTEVQPEIQNRHTVGSGETLVQEMGGDFGEEKEGRGAEEKGLKRKIKNISIIL